MTSAEPSFGRWLAGGLLGGMLVTLSGVLAAFWYDARQSGTENVPPPVYAELPPPQAPSQSYTDAEYAMYLRVIQTPMSISEAEVFAQLAREHGITPAQAKETVERVMRAVHSGGRTVAANREDQIRQKISSIGRAGSVSVTADFASIVFTFDEPVWNDEALRQRAGDKLVAAAASAFSVEGIQRVRIAVRYPATDGADAKVATLDVQKSEFSPGRPVTGYTGFSFVGRLR